MSNKRTNRLTSFPFIGLRLTSPCSIVRHIRVLKCRQTLRMYSEKLPTNRTAPYVESVTIRSAAKPRSEVEPLLHYCK